MAPAPRYPPVEQTLRRLLADAREQGASFDEAWRRAVEPGRMVLTNDPAPPDGALLWPTDRDSRRLAQVAITDCREAFRRAYELEPPTPGDLAVSALAQALAEPEDELQPRQPPWRSRGAGPSRPRGVVSPVRRLTAA